MSVPFFAFPFPKQAKHCILQVSENNITILKIKRKKLEILDIKPLKTQAAKY